MKKCSKCKTTKPKSSFTKSSIHKDGVSCWCKNCVRDKDHTKKGLIFLIYRTQKRKSKLRGHRPPEYTRQELYDWLFSQVKFHSLFSEWKESGYKSKLRPSVDRKEDSIHYCMANIQLMTWYDNDLKETNKQKKPVIQYTKEGIFISSFSSASEAGRKTKAHLSHILRCCAKNKGFKTAGGFIWEFAEQLR